MSKVITVKNLYKKYNSINSSGIKYFLINQLTSNNEIHNNYTKRNWALNDITFTLDKGDSLAIMGHNGSGKSTLLSLLSGVLYADKGTVHVNGKSSSLLELGVGFHADLTGSENIYIYSSFLGRTIGETKKIYNEIIEFSELYDAVYNPIRTYSSGMIARLMFSVLISFKPDILLIDEVYAVGDIRFRIKCMDYITKFINKGGSLIFVTHETEGIEKICNNGICLKQGKIISKYSLNDAISSYLNDSE